MSFQPLICLKLLFVVTRYFVLGQNVSAWLRFLDENVAQTLKVATLWSISMPQDLFGQQWLAECVCASTRVCEGVDVWGWVPMCVCEYISAWVCVWVSYKCVCASTKVCVRVWVYVGTNVCLHVCVCCTSRISWKPVLTADLSEDKHCEKLFKTFQ